MAEGNEYIGVTTHINQQPTKQYNKKDDFSLYKEPYSLQLLQQGMFAVFYPDDLHLPGINYHKVAKVKKVVVKVKL
jgi:YhcH/YjgK/YiaL family protein